MRAIVFLQGGGLEIMTWLCIGIVIGVALGALAIGLVASGAVADAWLEGYRAGQKGGRNV